MSLTDPGRIGAPRWRFIALPVALDGDEGSPLRAVAPVD